MSKLAGMSSPKQVAVIDIGSTSARMVIAEINNRGKIRTLESFQQAVSLGHDTFTKDIISRESIEECVKAMKSFSKSLAEYQIFDRRQIRAVATSAVREANNCQEFLDRIFIATGITVEPVDEAEVNRYTYLSVQPYLKHELLKGQSNTIVVEVGSGSTELLIIRRGRITLATTFRFGSFRLREMLEDYSIPPRRFRTIMEEQISRIVTQIQKAIPSRRQPNLVVLGGDIRFAAEQLTPGWAENGVAALDIKKVDRFTDGIFDQSVDDLVRSYHITYPEAETLAPALLTYVQIGKGLGIKDLMVTTISMRDGVLAEMATHGSWNIEFAKQIVSAAQELGKKFNYDQKHSKHVTNLSQQLFKVLKSEHQLPERFGLILTIGAILHDIGLFISTRSHHKHSMYLINNSELFGFGPKETLITALIARYHRRALPKASHPGYSELDRNERIIVSKLSALLRIADALDRGHGQRIKDPTVRIEDGRLLLLVENVSDITLEEMAIKQKGDLFEQVFGLPVVLRKKIK